MNKISATEASLNMLMDELTKLIVPHSGTAVFHLKGLNKAELMDLASKLGQKLIKPEDNLFADTYTLQISYSEQVQILMHSDKVKFKKEEIIEEKEQHPLTKKFA